MFQHLLSVKEKKQSSPFFTCHCIHSLVGGGSTSKGLGCHRALLCLRLHSENQFCFDNAHETSVVGLILHGSQPGFSWSDDASLATADPSRLVSLLQKLGIEWNVRLFDNDDGEAVRNSDDRLFGGEIIVLIFGRLDPLRLFILVFRALDFLDQLIVAEHLQLPAEIGVVAVPAKVKSLWLLISDGLSLFYAHNVPIVHLDAVGTVSNKRESLGSGNDFSAGVIALSLIIERSGDFEKVFHRNDVHAAKGFHLEMMIGLGVDHVSPLNLALVEKEIGVDSSKVDGIDAIRDNGSLSTLKRGILHVSLFVHLCNRSGLTAVGALGSESLIGSEKCHVKR